MMDFFDSIWYLLAMVVFFGAQIPIILRTDNSTTRLTAAVAIVLLGVGIVAHPIFKVVVS